MVYEMQMTGLPIILRKRCLGIRKAEVTGRQWVIDSDLTKFCL